MPDEKKEKKEKRLFRRLPPVEVIALRKLQRADEDLREKFMEWTKEQADELGLYADQLDAESGIVRDPFSQLPAPRKEDTRGIIKRLDFKKPNEKQVLDEARAKVKEIGATSKKFRRALADISLKYGIPAKALNLENGEITEDVVIETLMPIGDEEFIKDTPEEAKDEKVLTAESLED